MFLTAATGNGFNRGGKWAPNSAGKAMIDVLTMNKVSRIE